MIIDLCDRWRIRRYDGLNFVLEYFQEGGLNPKTRKKADDRWVIKGYYLGLESCIKAIPRHMAFDPAIGTLEELITRFQEVSGLLKSMFDVEHNGTHS